MQCRGVISGLGFRHGMARLPWSQCRPPRGFWEDSYLKPRHTNLGAHFDRHCRHAESPGHPCAALEHITSKLPTCWFAYRTKLARLNGSTTSRPPPSQQLSMHARRAYITSPPLPMSRRGRDRLPSSMFSRGINRRTRLCSSTAGSSIRVARLLRVFSSRNRKRASSSRARFILVQSCRPASAHRASQRCTFYLAIVTPGPWSAPQTDGTPRHRLEPARVMLPCPSTLQDLHESGMAEPPRILLSNIWSLVGSNIRSGRAHCSFS